MQFTQSTDRFKAIIQKVPGPGSYDLSNLETSDVGIYKLSNIKNSKVRKFTAAKRNTFENKNKSN